MGERSLAKVLSSRNEGMLARALGLETHSILVALRVLNRLEHSHSRIMQRAIYWVESTSSMCFAHNAVSIELILFHRHSGIRMVHWRVHYRLSMRNCLRIHRGKSKFILLFVILRIQNRAIRRLNREWLIMHSLWCLRTNPELFFIRDWGWYIFIMYTSGPSVCWS